MDCCWVKWFASHCVSSQFVNLVTMRLRQCSPHVGEYVIVTCICLISGCGRVYVYEGQCIGRQGGRKKTTQHESWPATLLHSASRSSAVQPQPRPCTTSPHELIGPHQPGTGSRAADLFAAHQTARYECSLPLDPIQQST